MFGLIVGLALGGAVARVEGHESPGREVFAVADPAYVGPVRFAPYIRVCNDATDTITGPASAHECIAGATGLAQLFSVQNREADLPRRDRQTDAWRGGATRQP